jgi:hypothetical protein
VKADVPGHPPIPEGAQTMKKLLLVFVMSTPFAHAQVSCTPKVDRKLCAEAAEIMDHLVDHGILKGVAIPFAIVTPPEYKKRLSDLEELEAREESILGGPDVAAKSPNRFSPWYKHTLTNLYSEDVTFFRSDPSSSLVSTVLVSSAAFDVTEFIIVGDKRVIRHSGQFDPSRITPLAAFISGYLSGTMAKMLDSSRMVKEPSLPRFTSITKDFSYDTETNQPCWSDPKGPHPLATEEFTNKPIQLPTCRALAGDEAGKL